MESHRCRRVTTPSRTTTSFIAQLLVVLLAATLIETESSLSSSSVQSDGGGSMTICHGNERLTELRFYVQDLVGGDHPTVWKVAQSNLSDVLPSGFGVVSLLDNLVTAEPDIGSKQVGRIQGFIGLSDLHEKALVMALNVVFTMEEYKGSTLSFLGRNPLEDQIREIPIGGGTGIFRMARGYALTSTYSVDEQHTHGVVQYDVVVCHLRARRVFLPQQSSYRQTASI